MAAGEEDPAQVREEERLAALAGVEEDAVEVAVHREHPEAASIAGPTTRSTPETAAAAQVKIGARRQAIPGARMFASVANVQVAEQTNPSVARPMPPIQASTPCDGEKTSSESGGSGESAVSGTA